MERYFFNFEEENQREIRLVSVNRNGTIEAETYLNGSLTGRICLPEEAGEKLFPGARYTNRIVFFENGERYEIRQTTSDMVETLYDGKKTGKYYLRADELEKVFSSISQEQAFSVIEKLEEEERET